MKDYGNVTEERKTETSQMSQIHGHERLLRNPEEVAKFNGKVVYVLNICMFQLFFNQFSTE